MSSIQSYTTVNSSTQMTVAMNSISHIIENKNTHDDGQADVGTTWIHFHSGKSVHVTEPFNTVHDDLEDFHSTRI